MVVSCYECAKSFVSDSLELTKCPLRDFNLD